MPSYASTHDFPQEVSFTATPYPDIRIKPGSQKHVLYERLKAGAIMNFEIREVTGSMNHTRRISELRKQLEAHGWTIASYNLGEGVWRYRLEPLILSRRPKTPAPGRISRFVGMLRGLVGGR